ncbi:mCG145497, partial [Mus musculus]
PDSWKKRHHKQQRKMMMQKCGEVLRGDLKNQSRGRALSAEEPVTGQEWRTCWWWTTSDMFVLGSFLMTSRNCTRAIRNSSVLVSAIPVSHPGTFVPGNKPCGQH